MTLKHAMIIGHRGASGYLPENTLAAFSLAIEMGADAIELDIVPTKEGELIARHENDLTHTTNISQFPEFTDRLTAKSIYCQEITGWFTEDFTLAEIKTLKAKERHSFRQQSANYLHQVPTLQEVIDLVKHQRTSAGRAIGLYIEIKHSTYFRTIGLPMEEPLVEILSRNGYNTADAPIAIESFESESLKHLHQLTQVPLVQLRQDLTSASELANIAEYAVGLAPYKRLIVPTDERGHLLAPTSLIQDAHQLGLKVYSWTFRNENMHLAPEYQGNPQAEYEQFLLLGLDGVFSDFPDTAVSVRDRLHPSQ
ncbi:MAG: glycerophosphodiester phosphodiesterase [Hormoscilla sp. GM7CHS1pb]|nr:glycerophosphodiester phosphodiesterase [Hormoscilla sp. GM7CHS1pb]